MDQNSFMTSECQPMGSRAAKALLTAKNINVGYPSVSLDVWEFQFGDDDS